MVVTDQIKELLAAYERSLNTADTALAVSCYAKDGVFMPNALPTASGAELTNAYDQVFAAIRLAVTFTIDELVVASDTAAFALTRSNGTQTVLSTGITTAESNREMFVFALENGDWKISRYMFNKSE